MRLCGPMPGGFQSITVEELDELGFVAMGQDDAVAVTAWRYPGVYAFYDFVADPEDHADLLDPRHRQDVYFAARLPAAGLVGFVELMPGEPGEVEIGLGLRPECTDRGLGLPFVEHVCSWVSDRVDPGRLVLRVATFNARAIRVYERAGFTTEGTEIRDAYGVRTEFLRMGRTTRAEQAAPGASAVLQSAAGRWVPRTGSR